jgi:hypothetical protein
LLAAGGVLFVGQEFVQRSPFPVLAVGMLVDGQEGDRPGLLDPLGVFFGSSPRLAQTSSSVAARPRLLLHFVDGVLELAGAGAGPPRAPVHPAQLIEDRAADPQRGVAGKRTALLGVELAHGGDAAR